MLTSKNILPLKFLNLVPITKGNYTFLAMKLKLNYILIIVCILFAQGVALAGLALKIDGKAKSIATHTISNNKFYEIEQFRKTFFAEFKANKDNFSFVKGKLEIKFVPGSFFVSLRNDDKIKIAQLRLPVAKQNSNIFIPSESILTALDSLGLYRLELEDEVAELTSLLDEMTTASETDPAQSISYKSLPKIKFNLNLMGDVSKETAEKIEKDRDVNDFVKLLIDMKQSLNNLEANIKTKAESDKKRNYSGRVGRSGGGRSAYDLQITGDEGTAPRVRKSSESGERIASRPRKKVKSESHDESDGESTHTSGKIEEYVLPKALIRSDIESKINEK